MVWGGGVPSQKMGYAGKESMAACLLRQVEKWLRGGLPLLERLLEEGGGCHSAEFPHDGYLAPD